jgi:hypothetical protein
MQILSWVSSPHSAHLLWDFLFASCTIGAPFRAIMGLNSNYFYLENPEDLARLADPNAETKTEV